MTLAAVAFIWFIVIDGLIGWALINAVWVAGSRAECVAILQQRSGSVENYTDGACWAFIIERWYQFIYGYYPQDQAWRIDVAFILLVLSLVPVLWDKCPARGKLILGSLAYPLVAYWLLVGGFFGLSEVRSDQFGGFMLTMTVGVTGIALSLPIGIMLALGRRSELPLIRVVCVCFIELIRGVPLITLLFSASTLLNYFFPPGTSVDLLLRVLIMVTLFASAYMAEVIRGGLQAIPKGQYEAADAMGLKYWPAMYLIVLPQALKISIPGIVNTFIGLFKDTTLVSIIGLSDPLGVGKRNLSDTTWQGLAAEMYLFLAVMFFIFCFAMSRYSLYLERKLDTGHKR
jgi:general L-amino acid transport system permease protein